MSSLLASPLIAVLNHLLASAEWARRRLLPHAGRRAELRLPLGTVHLAIAQDGTLAESAGEAEPDLVLSLTEGAALAALAGTDAAMKHVRIAGNADFGEALGFVLRHLEWDAEADLARLVGDVAAPRIHRSLVSILTWQRDVVQRGSENLRDYLVHERPTLVAHEELDRYAGDLITLADDLARLEKRVAKLGARA